MLMLIICVVGVLWNSYAWCMRINSLDAFAFSCVVAWIVAALGWANFNI